MVTFETDGTNSIYYTYDSVGKLISMNLNGTEYYYIRNGQGDIIGLYDTTGAQVVSYIYDTWGKLISTDGTLKDTVGKLNPYRYRGYRYDTDTGLYYLQSRYYNPEWGRFLNADALAGQDGEILDHNLEDRKSRNQGVESFLSCLIKIRYLSYFFSLFPFIFSLKHYSVRIVISQSYPLPLYLYISESL